MILINKPHKLAKALGLAAILMLDGCGKGGTTTSVPNSSVKIVTGVAAAGAPVDKGIGYALDAVTGTQIAFVTGTAGAYSVDLNGYTGPFLLHVRGITNGGSSINLYSLASSTNFGKTVNITPLSDIVVGYAAGQTAANLELACTSNQAGCPALLNGIIANLALSNSRIIQAIPAAVLAAFGVDPATFDALTTQFSPTHAGVDGLLDALQIVPPGAAGTSYAINLIGATPTPLVTVPVAGTATAPSTSATAPTAAAVTQAANLATALAEIQAGVVIFNQNMAAAAPGFPTAASISAGLDPAFKLNGMNGAAFANLISGGQGLPAGAQIVAGAQAAYSGAAWAGAATGPAASITYDANNCVTSLGVYSGSAGLVSGIWSFNKTITNPTGCVGTWKNAGNQANYYVEILPIFEKKTSANVTTYFSGFHLNTMADGTLATAPKPPFVSVDITGPGLTTQGNFAAKGTGAATTAAVTLVAPSGFTSAQAGQSIQNRINDPYYPGTSVLEDCATLTAAATAATPCYDNTAAVAGSDYVVRFLDATAAVLETVTHRLHTTLGTTSVPVSWYPTITGVTPAQASSIPLGTASTVTTAWTLPAGATADWGHVWLNDATGYIWSFEQPVSTTTSNTIAVPASLARQPTSGSVGVLAPIGGLKVGANLAF